MKNPTVPNIPNRAVFYARVSSEGRVDNTSIDTQLERGRAAYAISQGWTLWIRYSSTAGNPGRVPIGPVFRRWSVTFMRTMLMCSLPLSWIDSPQSEGSFYLH
jgi:hypothetical protein